MRDKKRNVRSVLFKKKKKWGLSVVPRKRGRNTQLSLLADFLANRISAAGMSHVVKAPSPFRRTFWLIIIILTATAMTVMTYRVLKEYLQYPTILRSKATAVKELEFPAITVCGLTPIPKLYAKEAGLLYLQEMEAILDNLPTYNVSLEDKTRCLKDPLCYWSWFDDVCLCYENPCQTLYCFPDIDNSDDKCACSMLMCLWKGSFEACKTNIDSNGTTWCICTSNFTYALSNMKEHKMPSCTDESEKPCDTHKPEPLPKEFLETLESLNASEQIKTLLGKVKESRTKDLRDVERFFVPSVRVMDDYGLPADSFILSCNYGMHDCWELITLYTPSEGKCYMFNYVGKKAKNERKGRIVTQAGKTYGLQLFLRSRSKDFLPLLTRQLGVRVVIHDPRVIPVTSEDGVDIRPGDMTSISLQFTEINRLGPPWGQCAKDGEQLGNYSRDPYTQGDCERECVNMEVFRRCHCYHPRYIRATTSPKRGNLCQTNNTSNEDECFRGILKDNEMGIIKCNCPAACRQKSYEISMSTSKLNEDFFELVKMTKSLTMKNGTPSVTRIEFESGLMGVQIYYNALFVTSINETEIYSWESLVANIGGNMGLFLGLSLVTFLEILEFVGELISKAITKFRTRASKVKDVTETF